VVAKKAAAAINSETTVASAIRYFEFMVGYSSCDE
jgi:hypothetical protein